MTRRILAGLCAGLLCAASLPAQADTETSVPDTFFDDILAPTTASPPGFMEVAEFRMLLQDCATISGISRPSPRTRPGRTPAKLKATA